MTAVSLVCATAIAEGCGLLNLATLGFCLIFIDSKTQIASFVAFACAPLTLAAAVGVLRCDWSEVASIVGVAVTPIVGFMGDLSIEQLQPNPDEVSHCFTIPIKRVRFG